MLHDLSCGHCSGSKGDGRLSRFTAAAFSYLRSAILEIGVSIIPPFRSVHILVCKLSHFTPMMFGNSRMGTSKRADLRLWISDYKRPRKKPRSNTIYCLLCTGAVLAYLVAGA